MAIYFPPPPPIVAVGAGQPYGPVRSAVVPTIWTTDSPIPRGQPPPWFYVIVRCWDPPPPQPPFKPPLAATPGWSVDNPPITGPWPAFNMLRRMWEPGPPVLQQGARLVPIAVVVSADNPPFGIPPPWLQIVRAAWEPGPPKPPVSGYLSLGIPGPSINNPPFGLPNPIYTIQYSWQPIILPPQMKVYLVISGGAAPVVVLNLRMLMGMGL